MAKDLVRTEMIIATIPLFFPGVLMETAKEEIYETYAREGQSICAMISAGFETKSPSDDENLFLSIFLLLLAIHDPNQDRTGFRSSLDRIPLFNLDRKLRTSSMTSRIRISDLVLRQSLWSTNQKFQETGRSTNQNFMF